MTEVFETHWIVGDEIIHDTGEVWRRVMAGAIAVEVTAESQRDAHKLRQAQEAWHKAALERHAEHVQEQQFRESPEGRRQAAVRDAARHGGSLVTLCPQDAGALSELDQYGADNTNPFKQ